MFGTILVAVDLNHEASWRRALPVAVGLARSSGAELHVTSVVPDFGSALVQAYFPPDFEKNALARAEAELERVVAAEVPEGTECHLHLEHGSIRQHILERARTTGADLIVMASHQPDQLREFLVGSHADWIVRHAPISVLVVREAP